MWPWGLTIQDFSKVFTTKERGMKKNGLVLLLCVAALLSGCSDGNQGSGGNTSDESYGRSQGSSGTNQPPGAGTGTGAKGTTEGGASAPPTTP